ncbi:hypothetical protein GCM10011506_46480 [Marivirga lumbricoides]|uniref:Uncharacterized protein n=1 Tax=Marivirga lumbricoides TaxID=1046115 RepID=A0ABQ1N6D0_9BACT|nr:hypothetical protein GCM10011506_46480 [Marivirga lumbricoides]
MKVIVNNHGIKDIDEQDIYPSYLHPHAYIQEGSEKKYLHCAQFIKGINMYSTYYAQNHWKNYSGEVYDCDSKSKIDFNKKVVFQNYVLNNDEIIPADKLEFLGMINFEFASEHFFKISEGIYPVYKSEDVEAIIDFGQEFAVFKLYSLKDFEYFQVEPNRNICWHIKDGIEQAFISENPVTNLVKDYRVAKIQFLL